MKNIGLFLLLVCPLVAQTNNGLLASAPSSITAPAEVSSSAISGDITGRRLYFWSVAGIIASNAADTASSWHRTELNPVLAGSHGTFDARSVMLKSAVVGTTLLLEHWALRHSPALYRSLAWTNVAISGGLAAVVAHNVTVH